MNMNDKLSVEYFIKLFEIGNAIRGWTGDGPYVPLNQRPNSPFETNASLRLVAFTEFKESLPDDLCHELDNLIVIHDKGRDSSYHNESIHSLCQHVLNGRASCFMASSYFMFTAVYYLKHRHNYQIPNIDINELQFFC